MKTRAVNKKVDQWDVYIGRGSKWGNPFIIGKDGNRAEVLDKYEAWLNTQTHLLASLGELRGKRLGCFCKPAPCHGDVLARKADALNVRFYQTHLGGNDLIEHLEVAANQFGQAHLYTNLDDDTDWVFLGDIHPKDRSGWGYSMLSGKDGKLTVEAPAERHPRAVHAEATRRIEAARGSDDFYLGKTDPTSAKVQQGHRDLWFK